MIQEVRIPFLLSGVFALAHNVPDVTPEQFKNIVLERLAEKDSVMIVEKNDNRIRGFLFMTVDRFQGEEVYVAQYAYVDPQATQAGRELFERACKIARDAKMKQIYMMTTRKPDGFERKYQFAIDKYILKRSV